MICSHCLLGVGTTKLKQKHEHGDTTPLVVKRRCP